MDVLKFVVYILGLVLVAGAVWMLFFETGLADRVPFGVVVAALLLVMGVGLMAGVGLLGPRDAVVVERRRW